MIIKIDEFSKSKWFQFRVRGWHIWYFQNLLILMTAFLILPNFILQLLYFWQLGDFFGKIINTIYFIALLLDLVAISLISITFLIEVGKNKETAKYIRSRILLGVSGIIWVVIGVWWRVPFFWQGPLDFGFGFNKMVEPIFLTHFALDAFSLLTLVGGSLVFLVFLLFHDFLHLNHTSYKEPRTQSFRYFPNIGTLYGISNILGTLLLVLFGLISMIDQAYPEPKPDPSPLIQWVPLLVIITKLTLTPILGMRTTRKLISCSTDRYSDQELVGDSFKEDKQLRIWIKRIFNLCSPVVLRPSKRTINIISMTSLMLLIIPFSPFFALNFLPTPHIEGPLIYRNAPTSEAMEVLCYVEGLDLGEITGYQSFRPYGPHLMTNETLQKYLQTINKVKSGLIGGPYHMKLIWNVTLVAADEPILNITTFTTYWAGIIGYLTWWEDDNQSSAKWVDDHNQIGFGNYSHPITWIYFGEFEYTTVSGALAFMWTEVKQVLFLDSNLTLVCLVHCGHTAIG